MPLNNNRQTTTSPTTLFNPRLQHQLVGAVYTQPLLRNFKIDNTRQQLAVTQLNQDI